MKKLVDPVMAAYAKEIGAETRSSTAINADALAKKSVRPEAADLEPGLRIVRAEQHDRNDALSRPGVE